MVANVYGELTIKDYYLDPMLSLPMDATLAIISTFRLPAFFFSQPSLSRY